jgi:hypothetical protein
MLVSIAPEYSTAALAASSAVMPETLGGALPPPQAARDTHSTAIIRKQKNFLITYTRPFAPSALCGRLFFVIWQLFGFKQYNALQIEIRVFSN